MKFKGEDRDDKQRVFIKSLRRTYNVEQAAEEAGIGRRTAYNWREEDKEFAQRWDDALEGAVDVLEGTLYQQTVRELQTDGLTTASVAASSVILKGGRPTKYGNRVDFAFDGRIQVEYVSDWRGDRAIIDMPAIDAQPQPQLNPAEDITDLIHATISRIEDRLPTKRRSNSNGDEHNDE